MKCWNAKANTAEWQFNENKCWMWKCRFNRVFRVHHFLYLYLLLSLTHTERLTHRFQGDCICLIICIFHFISMLSQLEVLWSPHNNFNIYVTTQYMSHNSQSMSYMLVLLSLAAQAANKPKLTTVSDFIIMCPELCWTSYQGASCCEATVLSAAVAVMIQ